MFGNILGGVFILLGVLFFLHPEVLRKRLRRKAIWRLRRYFLAAALSLGILLISVGWRHEGILPKVLMFIGIVALLKGLLFLNSKAAEKVTAWILERPIFQLKLCAVGQITLGVLILFGLKG